MIVPLSRTSDPQLIEMGAREKQALATSLSAGIRHAEVPVVLRMLDQSRPPPKRFRRLYRRRRSWTEGYAKINAHSYLELERVVQHITLYDVRNRLPAVLAAYDLAVSQGIPTSRLFHNGLLSGYAIAAILSAVAASETGTKRTRADTASRQQESRKMKNPSTGATASHFISGVNLPVIEAEPEVVVAFNKFRADAVKGIEEEIDQTDEIEELIGKGRMLLRRLEH